MAGIDLVDGLLALGVVTREQVDSLPMVGNDTALTVLGKLMSCGVQPHEVMPAASSLTGIPLAPPELLRDAKVVPVVDEKSWGALRDLIIAPVGVDERGVVLVLVSGPEALPHLPHLIGPHRAFLAEERAVRWLLERVLPRKHETGPVMVMDIGDQLGMARRAGAPNASEPSASNLELGSLPSDPRAERQLVTERDFDLVDNSEGSLRLDLNKYSGVPQPGRAPEAVPQAIFPPPAAPAAPTSTPMTTGAPHVAPQIAAPMAPRPALVAGQSGPVRSASPAPFAAPAMPSAPSAGPVDLPSEARARPAPPRPPVPLAAPLRPSPSPDAPLELDRSNAPAHGAPPPGSQSGMQPGSQSGMQSGLQSGMQRPTSSPGTPVERVRPRTGETRAPVIPPKKSRKTAAVVAVVVVLVVVIAGGVAFNRRGAGHAGPEPTGDQMRSKQQAALTEAQMREVKGDHVWAIAGYSTVIDLDPSSALAGEARIGRAIAEANSGDLGNARQDLDFIIKSKPVGNPLRTRAEERLRLLSQ